MSFDVSINRLLKNEGGYTDGEGDPGGETNWGISKRSYPHLDIKNLTRDEAIEIYRRDFWLCVNASEMPEVLQFQALDFAVNAGIQTAIRKLQAAAGVADDGHWGPITRAAVQATSPAKLVLRFLAEQADFRRKLSTWPRFGAGWTGRLAEDLRYAAEDL